MGQERDVTGVVSSFQCQCRVIYHNMNFHKFVFLWKEQFTKTLSSSRSLSLVKISVSVSFTHPFPLPRVLITISLSSSDRFLNPLMLKCKHTTQLTGRNLYFLLCFINNGYGPLINVCWWVTQGPLVKVCCWLSYTRSTGKVCCC